MLGKLANWPIEEIDITSKAYPIWLKKIKNPPQKLYYRGNFNKQIFNKCLAVVGSRKNTRYGQEAIEGLIPKLVEERITIISGFMYGIDSLAHNCCLEYGGKTIAVLGCGLNVIYPQTNDKLYLKILENGGLVISEYSPETKPNLWTFPQRNRIVAGLANRGILVIEAGEKSGSLITARIGLEENRQIYCIPGPITSKMSVGSNWLIKSGKAKLVDNVYDILDKSGQNQHQQMTLFADLSGTEKEIMILLQNEPLIIDQIVKKTSKPIDEIVTNLSLLEMKGLVREISGIYGPKN